MKIALTVLTGLLYLAGTLLYFHYFVTRKQKAEKAGLAAIWGGFALHTILLVIVYVEVERFPVISLKESLNFFSWSMAAMYLALRTGRQAGPMGTFVLPLVAGFYITAAFLGHTHFAADDRFDTALFPLHILITFLGYAAFTLAFGAGVMYMLQERGLKSRRPGKMLDRLPSLHELDRLIYRSLMTGFPLLTLGIILGAVWLRRVEGAFVTWEPKIIASLATWLLYAAILHARLLAGWRGRKLAAMSVLGFGLVLFTFLGAEMASGGFHRFFNYP